VQENVCTLWKDSSCATAVRLKPQKPPFMAKRPERHASTDDPATWCEYKTALATVQAGDADGITYMLTEDDPFAAIDLDHCRDARLCSIDIWAQNFLDTARYNLSSATPLSGNVACC
jgi:primase-polymerase (primpol)-like protein